MALLGHRNAWLQNIQIDLPAANIIGVALKAPIGWLVSHQVESQHTMQMGIIGMNNGDKLL